LYIKDLFYFMVIGFGSMVALGWIGFKIGALVSSEISKMLGHTLPVLAGVIYLAFNGV